MNESRQVVEWLAEIIWRSWFLGMQAQERDVAPERQRWATLPEREKELDRFIAQCILLRFQSDFQSDFQSEVQQKLIPATDSGDPFNAIVDELKMLHARKSTDYGSGGDAYANLRGATDWDVPWWVGACIRQEDKIRRLKSFVRRGSLENESVEDALMDNAVYAIIALLLYREEKA